MATDCDVAFVRHPVSLAAVGVARRLAPALIAIGLAGPAMASVLPIAGAYGNDAGCAFFLRGEVGVEMALVTGDTLTSPAGACDFVNFVSAGDHEFVAEAVCTGIGEINPGLDHVTVRDEGKAGYYVMIEKAEVAGPLAPCPGAEELMSPGVRI